jgi:hypothetical protein
MDLLSLCFDRMLKLRYQIVVIRIDLEYPITFRPQIE